MYVVLRAQGCWSLFFFFQVVQSVLVCFKLVRLLWVVVGCQSRVFFFFLFLKGIERSIGCFVRFKVVLGCFVSSSLFKMFGRGLFRLFPRRLFPLIYLVSGVVGGVKWQII